MTQKQKYQPVALQLGQLVLIPRQMGLLISTVSAVFCAGCATFRGPGPLVTDTSEKTAAASAPEAPLAIEHGLSAASREDAIGFGWPVDEARFSRGFQSTSSQSGRKRAHWGVDLANHRGTPILASRAGKVIYTGHAFRGYGKLIVIEHGKEWATLYSHLDKILVKEGEIVAQGSEIGRMGRTGRASGVHLHFEIRRNRHPVNPLAYLPETGANAHGASNQISTRPSSQLSARSTDVEIGRLPPLRSPSSSQE